MVNLVLVVDTEYHAAVELTTLIVSVIGNRFVLAVRLSFQGSWSEVSVADQVAADCVRTRLAEILVIEFTADGVGVAFDDDSFKSVFLQVIAEFVQDLASSWEYAA